MSSQQALRLQDHRVKSEIIQPTAEELAAFSDVLTQDQARQILLATKQSVRVLLDALGTDRARKIPKPDGQMFCPADHDATVPFFVQVVLNRLFAEYGFAIEEEVDTHGLRHDDLRTGMRMTQDGMDGSGHVCGAEQRDLNQVGVMLSGLKDGVPQWAYVARPFADDYFMGNGRETCHSLHGRIELPEFDPNNVQFRVNRAGEGHRSDLVESLLEQFSVKAKALDHAGSVFAFTEWLRAMQEGFTPVIVHDDYKKLNTRSGKWDIKRGPWDKAPELALAMGLDVVRVCLRTGELHSMHGSSTPHILVQRSGLPWVREELIPRLAA